MKVMNNTLVFHQKNKKVMRINLVKNVCIFCRNSSIRFPFFLNWSCNIFIVQYKEIKIISEFSGKSHQSIVLLLRQRHLWRGCSVCNDQEVFWSQFSFLEWVGLSAYSALWVRGYSQKYLDIIWNRKRNTLKYTLKQSKKYLDILWSRAMTHLTTLVSWIETWVGERFLITLRCTISHCEV